jgi:hypothetical protein
LVLIRPGPNRGFHGKGGGRLDRESLIPEDFYECFPA